MSLSAAGILFSILASKLYQNNCGADGCGIYRMDVVSSQLRYGTGIYIGGCCDKLCSYLDTKE